MDKKEMRTIGKANLKWLATHPEVKQAKEQELCHMLYDHSLWKDAKVIAMTHSTTNEYNTHPLFLRGLEEKKIIAMPTTTKADKKLVFYCVGKETQFKESAFGIQEPVSEEIVLPQAVHLLVVPGIVFTLSGYRVGFGGGYYDRFLKDYSGPSCSLVFSEQIQEGWTIEPFDLPVHHLFIR